ncbi:hypothetical protein CKO15_10760 [Halorhodospira abdelmalekii]|uniref:hypothetical protein n=1 Tax=Halorhodospira abdelmalekii TaxID=421629 RepID=UPI0019039C1C|nr:hypothetical protein [Halorhodospira abdelmalekii]MBK1735749.1 hypothetical protein [Halorhodospira abdelmalekii]
MDRQGMLMNREHLHRRQNKMGISLDEYNLGELQELLAAIDREIEARSFADSLEAQLRLFMRRRGQ